MKVSWTYDEHGKQMVFSRGDDGRLLMLLGGGHQFNLSDLARACGYRLEKLPDAVVRWEEISEKDFVAKFKAVEKLWSTAAINMGMPEEDFPTDAAKISFGTPSMDWGKVQCVSLGPLPQQSNADLEEHIARSPEKEAAEYRAAVKKAIFRGPL